MFETPIRWVYKEPLKAEHIKEVPNDIAKQYLAMTLAKAFNERLKVAYPGVDVFLNYVQPYLVLPLFKVENEMSFYEMEKWVETNVQF